MKIGFHLCYEDEKITDFDVAKGIVEVCHDSFYKLNARKIAEMILIQVKYGDLERLWQDLKLYLENTKNNFGNNRDVLKVIEEMEKADE